MDTNQPNDPQFNKYYRKHLKCLKLAGLQPKTIEAYARAIRRISNYFDCRVDNLTLDQLLDYFNDLLDNRSWSAVKLDLYGLKFFYTNVLGKTWEDIPPDQTAENLQDSGYSIGRATPTTGLHHAPTELPGLLLHRLLPGLASWRRDQIEDR